MGINVEKLKRKYRGKDLKIGEGFNDARGYIPDPPGIPKNNGLNVNNDPARLRRKEKQQQEK